MDKNYRKLTLSFHPDRSPHYSAEVIWLDQQLSGELLKGGCFKLLSFCYEKLIQPTKFKEVEFSGIHSKEDFKKWLENYKAHTTTYASKSLCDSLIALIDASSDFFDSTGAIKPIALKNLVKLIPVIIAGFGTTLFFEELFLVYAAYYVLLKGGQKLGKTNYQELRQVGQLLQEYTAITAMTTTTLLVRILELIFWTSRHCLTISLEIGTTILAPLLSQTPSTDKAEVDAAELCKELVLAGEKIQPGIQFDTPELKLIASPFEKYLALNAQQFFGNFRVGQKKREMVDAFLFNLKVLDKLDWCLEQKYLDILQELDKIKQNKEVYTDKTKDAVDYVEEVISVLRSPSITALIPYEPEEAKTAPML
ncbi:J domain-containing protein [Legionella sp. km772]|uniref:J domain-containing protein n=1 Tax=Legionella sp. km772 TaxID=2498111 RepID=UPI000F8E544E|nr:J domain-containing protein [Legionella sp. km772]RUR07812.1 J domain-containing protein [Legionella sp. km772]